MSYKIESKPASKNGYFTPAEARKYYGKYSRDGITVHWWGGNEPASAHDNMVNYFLAQGKKGIKSVNYVVSDNKITKMVAPDNVAWASQKGNAVTISIEFQPTLHAEGYKRGGWLINELEKKYKKSLPLYPHSKWFATACPGSISLARLRQEANKFKTAKPVIKPTPKGGNEVFKNLTEVGQAYIFLRGKKGTTKEMQEWVGKPRQRFFITGLPEANNYRKERDSLRKLATVREQQIIDLQKLLREEKAKPPTEVVKEVTKIVEKPVGSFTEADRQTLGLVKKLYDYFYARWQTFRDFIDRR